MPERPDLEYVVPILARELTGRTITRVDAPNPVVLRVAVRDPIGVVVGKKVEAVTRRAHFVVLSLGDLTLVVSPMLAGRFLLAEATDKPPRDLAFTLAFDDDRELRYRDDVQMGKVYLIDRAAAAQVPGLATIGADVLDPEVFTKKLFREMAKKRRDQAKVFLMDKTALDAMGNAYADEVLFEARIHPKRMVRSLDEDEVDRLHDAIVTVLSSARDEIQRRAPPLDEKLRDFLKVRNKHKAPCPRCGTTLRKAGVHGHDAFYCPECQPDERKSALVDFRKVKPAG